jgi:hypothetical protein
MKKIFLFVFWSVLFCANSFAQDFLVSPDEMTSSNKAANVLTPKFVAQKDSPLIELLAPDLKAPIVSPASIQLKFLPIQPAQVVPSSFRVLYGSFQVDITNRLLPFAEVTDHGVNVKQAKLPSGSHKMTLQVTDSAGRQGFKTIEFEVK